MTKTCFGCEPLNRNEATWVHFDGLYESYYCDECIDLDAAGEQYKVEQ